MKFRIIYTLDDQVLHEYKEFESMPRAEDWLEEIGAVYWEIGMSEEDFKECFYK